MARKLKTFQTSLGFFDQAIAAPTMKAALEAWGTKTNLFHQGVAKEVDDPDVIAATMHTQAPDRIQWAVQRALTCPRTFPLARSERAEPQIGQQSESRPARSMTMQPVRPPWRSRESRDSVKPSA